ncbi:hypothetical protein [Xanthomonas sp. CFBP 8445]|uniref:hypothetical protein n=1 Tax=Xanthomonas sp. CFBP 8445 TaxID=2971236 RepID=UPI0021E0F629|nr:hypothetical protein [Xanthomonas sp. CFBP 8445]UYC10657.1 hypothetical protein NUG21_12760 [Xanthomonas sp. CFBP 8445]
MAAGTRLMLRLYLPPALLALGGFVIAEVLLHLANGLHAPWLARTGSLLSLFGLLAATAWALWASWRAWHRQRYAAPTAAAAVVSETAVMAGEETP